MDFLQRHLPRVHQAVQNALDYLTNVTAQIFGAPPNAPQPRNARTNVPIKTPDTSEGSILPATTEEICAAQVADHLTAAPDILSEPNAVVAAEQNVEKAESPPGDAENPRQETDLRHRKSNSGGNLDLDYKISDDDLLSGFLATMEKHLENTAHSYNKELIDDVKPMETVDMANLSHNVKRDIGHAEGDPLTNLEIKKENQESLTYQGNQDLQHRGKRSIPEFVIPQEADELLRDLHHEVRGHIEDPFSDSSVKIGNICLQPNALDTVECKVHKEQSVVIDQEESEVDITASALPMDYDNSLDVTDINYPKQRKKFVTPASETDNPPYESRKTWEDLQETAARLALHCDLFQKDSQEREKLGEISETVHVDQLHSILTHGPGYIGEDVGHNSLLQDLREVRGSSREELMTKECTLSEQSRSPGDEDHSSGEEQMDLVMEGEESVRRTAIQEQTQAPSGVPVGGDEETNQHNERESHPKFYKNPKPKRRVHFSPSTEDLFKKLDNPSPDPAWTEGGYILEGALQQISEYTEHPTTSCSIIQSDQSLIMKREEDYLGDTSSTQDSGQLISDTITVEGQMNPLHTSGTVWYDEYERKTEADDKLCESIVDMVYQNATMSFQMEDTIMPITDIRSKEEHSDAEINENETESTKKTDAHLSDSVTLGNTELSLENVDASCHLHATMCLSELESPLESDQTKDTWISNKADIPLEKENRYLSVSDHLGQAGSDFAENNTTTVTESLEQISQSIDSTEGKEDFSVKEAIHGQDSPLEDNDINEELLGTRHHSSEVDGGSIGTTEDKDGFTKETDQFNSHESVDKIQSEPDVTCELSTGMFSSEAEDHLKFPQEDDESNSDQLQENRSLGQLVSPGSNDICEAYYQRVYESVRELSMGEIASAIRKVPTAEDLVSEEPSEGFRETNIPVVSEVYTYEIEEHYLLEEDNVGKQNDFHTHEEKLQPEASISQEYGREEQSVIENEASQRVENVDYLGDNKARYQNDAHDICSNDNEELGSQNEQDNSEVPEGSLGELGQITHKVSEGEDLSGDDQEIGHQIDLCQTHTDKEAGGSEAESLSIGQGGDPQTATGPVNELEEIFKSGEAELDLVSEIQSVMKPNHSGQKATVIMGELEVVSEGRCTVNQDTFPGTYFQESLEPGVVKENDKEMDTSLDASYITISNLETVPGTTSKSNFEANDVCDSQEGLDLLSEIQSMLIPKTMEDLDLLGKNQSAVAVDVPSDGYSGNQLAESVEELDVASGTGSLAGGHSENIDDILGSDTDFKADKVISDSQGECDILSEIQSVIETGHPAEVMTSVSTIKLADLDEGVGDEVDILEGTESSHPPGHSAEAAEGDILSEIATAEVLVDTEENAPTICHSQELGSSLEPNEGFEEKVSQHDSSSGVVVTETHIEEADIGLGIISSSKENEIVITTDRFGSENGEPSEMKSLTEVDLLSEIQSVIATGHSAEVTTSVSTIKLADTDEGMGDEVDILEGTESGHLLGHSAEAAEGDILSEIATAEVLVDTEENALAICHSQELGSSLEPNQEFEEKVSEHDSSSGVVVTETHIEEAGIGFGIISSSKENEIVITTDRFGSENEEPSEMKSLTEVDLLSEIQSVIATGHSAEVTTSVSTIKLADTDEGMGDKVDILDGTESGHLLGHSAEAAEGDILSEIATAEVLVDTEENALATCHPQELGSSLEPNQKFEEKVSQHDSLSGTVVIETHVAEVDIGLGIISSSKENEIVITTDLFGSENEEPSEMKSQTEVDLLSEIQSVIATGHSAEELADTDEGVGDEVEILEGTEHGHLPGHFAEAAGGDILSEIATTDKLVDTEENVPATCHSWELGSNQEFGEKVSQYDSSSGTVVTETFVVEADNDLGITSSSKDIEIVITTDRFGSENKEQSEIKSTEMDHIQQKMEEEAANQQTSSNQETITMHSDQTEHGVPGPNAREEHLPMIQSPPHKEIGEDQERPLVAQRGMLEEPAVQEEDDVDSNMLPYNTLDVSAQKSRVQLRRNTSIRRRQGPRQAVYEIEPDEPPPPPHPIIRPLSMGVPIFPGKLPIFPQAPTKTPAAPDPTEEHREEKPAPDDLAVKPKKGIPKHAGFGIPHPQMMQELQARLKKKKPKE